MQISSQSSGARPRPEPYATGGEYQHHDFGSRRSNRRQVAAASRALRRCAEALQAVQRILQGWIQFQRRAIVGDGLVAQAFGFIRDAAIFVGVGVLRVERDGLVFVGDGLVVQALGIIGEAAIIVDLGVLRVERDGLGVVGDGQIVQALGVIDIAAIGVGIDRLRVERDSLGEVGDGQIVQALGVIDIAAIVVGIGQVGAGPLA